MNVGSQTRVDLPFWHLQLSYYISHHPWFSNLAVAPALPLHIMLAMWRYDAMNFGSETGLRTIAATLEIMSAIGLVGVVVIN